MSGREQGGMKGEQERTVGWKVRGKEYGRWESWQGRENPNCH